MGMLWIQQHYEDEGHTNASLHLDCLVYDGQGFDFHKYISKRAWPLGDTCTLEMTSASS